jgi:hypothetical protein
LRVGRLCSALLTPVVAIVAWVGSTAGAHARESCAWTFPRDLPLVETNAFYWRLDVDLPPGAHFLIEGRFPYARQMSFNVHDRGDATLLAGITDVEIAPRRGNTNPFLAGAARDDWRRSYTATIARADARNGGSQVNVVRVPVRDGETRMLRLLYRIYLADADKPGGGADLPTVWRIDASGERERVSGSNCPRRGGMILAQEVGPTRLPAGPSTLAMPLDWRNAGASASAANSDVYLNRDNGYAYALTRVEAGTLLVLSGRAPTHPRTRNGNSVMGTGEVRYWSLCAYRHPSDRSARCLADEDIAVGDSGRFRVVLAPPGLTRPHLAERCGLAWLEAPSLGDGAIVLRHVAPDAAFEHTPLRGERSAPSATVMGPYLPVATVISVNTTDAELCAVAANH